MRTLFTISLIILNLFSFVQADSSKSADVLTHRLATLKQAEDHYEYIKTMIELSWCHFGNKDLSEAEKIAEKALKAATLYNSKELQISALNNLANILSAQGFFSDAELHYKKALSLDSKNPMLKLNLLNCLIRLGKEEESRALLNELHSLAHKKRLNSKLLLLCAEYAKQLTNYQLSRDFLKVAIEIGEKDRLADSYLEMGKLLILTNNYDDAVITLQNSLFHSSALLENPNLYKVHRYLADAFLHQGKVTEAIAEYRKSIEIAKEIRPELSKASNIAELRQISSIYYKLVELLIMNIGDDNQQTLREVTSQMDELRISELKNYFHDECVIEAESKKRSLEEIIDSSTALIHTVTLTDKLAVIVYKNGKYHLSVSDIKFKDLRRDVIELRLLCQTNSLNAINVAKRVYNTVIKPCDEKLKGLSHLVFIPDSRLQQIPWSVLHDGTQFLLEKYTLSTSSGMSLNSPKKLPIDESKALIAGVTTGLSAVNKEIETIDQLFPGKTLIDQKLTRESLEFQLRNYFYRIIHLATHADFTGTSELNYLLTGEGRMSMTQLQDWIRMSSLREDGIELLTLSACKTAVGDDINNLGLAGVAVRSGAKSVLASLWQVDDKATALFMTQFYKNLKDGDTKATALQKAQKHLLNHKTYNHPYYWAPFTLLGNWL